MNKKSIILLVSISIICATFFWFIYSLYRFDGFFPPNKLFLGIISPVQYYQENITKNSIKKFPEYKMDEVNAQNWKIYENAEYRFGFRYPGNLILKQMMSRVWAVCLDENQNKCPIEIQCLPNPHKLVYGIDRQLGMNNYEFFNRNEIFYVKNNSRGDDVILMKEEKDSKEISVNIIGNHNALYIIGKFDDNNLPKKEFLGIIKSTEFIEL